LRDRFRDEVNTLQLKIDDRFFGDIEEYIQLLQKWNRVHNLTRMGEDEILTSIIDSIAPFKDLDFTHLVDIGSGAVFPAIPIAILKRERKVTLIEPIKKKSAFLHYVKTSLKLSNVEIISNRVENIEIDKPDLITSRAVTETKKLLQLSKSLLKQGIKLIFYKGSNIDNEIKDLEFKYQIINRGNRNYLIIEI